MCQWYEVEHGHNKLPLACNENHKLTKNNVMNRLTKAEWSLGNSQQAFAEEFMEMMFSDEEEDIKKISIGYKPIEYKPNHSPFPLLIGRGTGKTFAILKTLICIAIEHPHTRITFAGIDPYQRNSAWNLAHSIIKKEDVFFTEQYDQRDHFRIIYLGENGRQSMINFCLVSQYAEMPIRYWNPDQIGSKSKTICYAIESESLGENNRPISCLRFWKSRETLMDRLKGEMLCVTIEVLHTRVN